MAAAERSFSREGMRAGAANTEREAMRHGVNAAMTFRPVYSLYEWWLFRRVASGQIPRHVGIILDGNRRHAHSLGVTDPHAVYEIGARKLDEVLNWCAELNIPIVTLWVFSSDNLRRSPGEVSGILAAVEAKLTALSRDPQIHRRRVRVRIVGDLSLLPPATSKAIRSAEQATASYQGLDLNIAVGYGGRQEIVDAVRKALADMAGEGKTLSDAATQLTADSIAGHLYTAGLPDPDLIIRTSGEIRLSGFLLWQSAHSEYYFSDVNWPAFRRIDLLRAIRSYQGRRRRFGR